MVLSRCTRVVHALALLLCGTVLRPLNLSSANQAVADAATNRFVFACYNRISASRRDIVNLVIVSGFAVTVPVLLPFEAQAVMAGVSYIALATNP